MFKAANEIVDVKKYSDAIDQRKHHLCKSSSLYGKSHEL